MNIKEKLEELRNAWINVPNISTDSDDIKVRRRVIEIRAKLLSFVKPVDTVTSETTDIQSEEFWNK